MSKSSPIFLGVNIDHVASLRQARGTLYPEPIQAALLSEQAGADSITLHLREDRRHIQARDVAYLKTILQTRMNLEMAMTDEMLAIACQTKPSDCCFVPERRQELTTEGGLDVIRQIDKVSQACETLTAAGIKVSLFIDPDSDQIDAANKTGAPVIEIHTGNYADAPNAIIKQQALDKIIAAAEYADSLGLQVNAGHGLHYHCVQDIARIPQIVELNIGHAIISQAIFTGLEKAVKEMKRLMVEARLMS